MQHRPFDVRQLVDLTRVTAAVPSPDGTWVAVAAARHDPERARYVSDLWRVPADGGAPIRLTRGAYGDRAPAFRRDGALGFLSNRPPLDGSDDHDEALSQVWLLPATGGEPFPLTDEPLGVDAFQFAKAGDRLVVMAPVLPGVPHQEQRATAAERKKKGPSSLRFRRMPVRYWDQWLPEAAPHLIAYDERGGARLDLTPDADREHREADWDLSCDGSQVVVTRAQPGPDRIDDHALLVVPCAGGAGRVLGAAKLTNLHGPRFSPDGRTIVCVRHVRGRGVQGGQQLHRFDVESGRDRPLAADWDAWPTPWGFTADGAAVICTAPWRGHQPVFRVEIATDQVERVTGEGDGGSHDGLSVLGNDVVFGVRSRLVHPPEPFRVRLDANARPKLLASMSGFTSEDGKRIAHVTSFEVTADDGASVHSFLLAPHGATARPTLLWIHGGPMSFWGDGWHWRWNPLVAVEAGYTVAMPNPRGSTGYGQAFVEGIWGNVWGGQCYRDLMAVTDALEKEAVVDPQRVAAMGGSFGGYMTNWIGGSTERFGCLITHASVYSMSGFHGVTDHPAYWAYAMGGAPYEGASGYDVYSPSSRIGRWKTPTLVIHGEKDYRVPISEGLALFEALQHHGVESELLVFPDENHWILKPRNVVVWYQSVLDWLDRHLKA